jgi:hypothetical protein
VWEKKTLDPTNLHYFASQKTYFPKSQTYPSNDIRFYVDAVNTEQYCGYSDWRVPSKDEALSLVSYARSSDGRKYIGGLDRTFFADPLYDEWTRECDVELCALTLFKDGESRLVSRIDTLAYARLVRGQGFVSDSARFIVANAEVKDKVTGVTWSRCAEGQTWLNSTCVGSPNSFTWQQAITIAAERTAATGVTWRLPNIKELMAVGNYPYGADAKAFPNSDAQVRTWSSTASFDPAGMRGSFFGSFGVGGVLISGGVGYVHLVHD